MNIALRPTMTREQFLQWAEQQEERYEFDGTRPIPVTGGSRNHFRIISNLIFALRLRLQGTDWEVLPEAGLATTGDKVRYPDVLVTRTPSPGTSKLMPGVVVVFEVTSPDSGRVDRVEKLREYAAVPSILRYVIVESESFAVTVFSRLNGEVGWSATGRGTGEVLELPELGIGVPMDEFYRGVDLPGDDVPEPA